MSYRRTQVTDASCHQGDAGMLLPVA